MTDSTKIVYEHLRDYPLSTEGFHDIGIPAVAAALCHSHTPVAAGKRDESRAHEPLWIDLWTERPWFAVP